MPQYVHGGDVYTYAEQYGSQPIDLSANINPFGMPEAVKRALHAAVEDCACYPDPFCRAPRRAIARAESVSPDWLYCGNGAADVLDRLAAVLRPKAVLLTAPTFAEYERTLEGAEIRFHLLRESEGFAVTERLLEEITAELDAVYLCNPNNPTGRTIQPLLLEAIADRCAALGVRLVVDECFHDFLADSAQHTLAARLPHDSNLILLRAYTKVYAIPGVRFGWCMTSDTALVEALYRAGQPWNVSVLAQACATAAAEEKSFAAQTAQRIATERAYLREALQARGFWVCAGEANFLLLRAADTALVQRLAARGVMLRSCANYRGLGAGWYRAAVKTRTETTALLAALDAIQKEDGA